MTAIDTNIVIALWDPTKAVHMSARAALDEALTLGSLVVGAPVYAELLAWPCQTEDLVNEFFARTEILIDWLISETIWRMAGKAYKAHSIRRRASKGGDARRILADFVIGAHAMANGYSLLTRDGEFYRRNFPALVVKGF
jgi:predicted nucleic acid-binding protein